MEGGGQDSYRKCALAARRAEHRARLAELDGAAVAHLPGQLRDELTELRARAEPGDDTVAALQRAERAADAFETQLDEDLGLAADLFRSMNPILPRRRVLFRWAGFAAGAVALVTVAGTQLGLDDFMLRAMGVKVQKAGVAIPTGRLEYQAEKLEAVARAHERPAAPTLPAGVHGAGIHYTDEVPAGLQAWHGDP